MVTPFSFELLPRIDTHIADNACSSTTPHINPQAHATIDSRCHTSILRGHAENAGHHTRLQYSHASLQVLEKIDAFRQKAAIDRLDFD